MSASGHSSRVFGIWTRSGFGRCTVQRVGAYTLAFPKRPPQKPMVSLWYLTSDFALFRTAEA